MEVIAETIFEERSLSLAGSFLGCCAPLLLPYYHQFPCCQFSSDEKERKGERAEQSQISFSFFLDDDIDLEGCTYDVCTGRGGEGTPKAGIVWEVA